VLFGDTSEIRLAIWSHSNNGSWIVSSRLQLRVPAWHASSIVPAKRAHAGCRRTASRRAAHAEDHFPGRSRPTISA